MLEGGETTEPPMMTSAAPAGLEIELKQGNANEYLDALLENVREYLVNNGYDNYTLPDVVEGFR